MLTNRDTYLKVISIFIALLFILFFINNLAIESKSNTDELLVVDHHLLNNDLIDDEIYPFCKGLKYEEYSLTNSVSRIDIDILNLDRWYENLFKLALEDQRAIEKKYKKKYDANLTIYYSDNIFCESKAKLRISGDWNDHIDKARLITSLDVELVDENILGITNFKLFLPETRNGDNEIVTTSIMESLNFLTPRTFYVNIGLKDFNNKFQVFDYIFQEKPSKEMLEFNQFREAPIYETNEEFMWNQILDGTYRENSANDLYPLMIAKVLNQKWSNRGMPNLEITLRGLESYNKAIFNSYNSFSQFNYGYFGKDQEIYYKFDATMIALLAEHGLTNHNRRFYFNVIENQFYPIYYDGNSNFLELGNIRNRSDYLNQNGLAFGAKLLLSMKKIDATEFFNSLKEKGLEITFDEAEKLISKFYFNLIEISNLYSEENLFYKDYFENSKSIFFDEGFQFLFHDSTDSQTVVCDFNLLNCDQVNIDFSIESIFDGKLMINDSPTYLLATSVESLFNLEDKSISRLQLDDFYIEIYGDPEIYINELEKELSVNFNKLDQKIKFFGPGSIKNWKFKGTSNISVDIQTSRIDKNLLTGCFTFYDLQIFDSVIITDSLFCEDAVNLLDVYGENLSLEISNSSFDSVDADFSQIEFSDIKISNSGNDCIDLSGGKYYIKNYLAESCSDKAISIGENSELNIDKANIENVKFGLVAKDSSKIKGRSININKSDMCLAVYRKKQEFGPSKVDIENLVCSSIYDNFIQLGSLVDVRS